MTASSKFSAPIAMVSTLATFITVYFGKANLMIYVLVSIIAVFTIYILFGAWVYSPKGTRQYETKTYWESDFGIKPNVEQYEMQLNIANMLNKIAEHLDMKERLEPSQEWKDTYAWLKDINKKNKFDEIVKQDLEKASK